MRKLKSIIDFSPAQLKKELELMGITGYRAKQIYHWLFIKGAAEFTDMTNLPKELQKQLQLSFQILPLDIIGTQVSKLDSTTKLLYKLDDGETIEAVVMYYGSAVKPDRITVCVSTQVGCSMGCSFCATGLSGYKRNLTSGEIIGQILGIQQLLKSKDPGLRITNVVYMGMGEPLQNYTNVLASINMLNKKDFFNISFRRITISTCGLVPQIYDLAGEGLPVVLAVSLHAADDQLRNKLMPVNRKYPIQELIAACNFYSRTTGRKVTFEYAMLANINDRLEDASRLVKLISGLLANINLIPLNEVPETGYLRSQNKSVKIFADYLTNRGIEVVVREEKGGDIMAACGQLRRAKTREQG